MPPSCDFNPPDLSLILLISKFFLSLPTVRIAMPGAPTPRIKRLASEPVKRASSPSMRIEEFKRLKQAKTPRGRASTPRMGL